MTEAEKAKHEIEVFGEFVNNVLTNEGNDGFHSCSPRKPDILFHSKDNPRYFELGRLTDSEMARTTLDLVNKMDKHPLIRLHSLYIL